MLQLRAAVGSIVMVGMLALTSCDHGHAPANWAERNRVTTGDPQGGTQPVDPRDARATQDVRTGQERFWMLVVTGLVVASGIAVAAGTWYFEVRRRARQAPRAAAAEPPRRRDAS